MIGCCAVFKPNGQSYGTLFERDRAAAIFKSSKRILIMPSPIAASCSDELDEISSFKKTFQNYKSNTIPCTG